MKHLTSLTVITFFLFFTACKKEQRNKNKEFQDQNNTEIDTSGVNPTFYIPSSFYKMKGKWKHRKLSYLYDIDPITHAVDEFYLNDKDALLDVFGVQQRSDTSVSLHTKGSIYGGSYPTNYSFELSENKVSFMQFDQLDDKNMSLSGYYGGYILKSEFTRDLSSTPFRKTIKWQLDLNEPVLSDGLYILEKCDSAGYQKMTPIKTTQFHYSGSYEVPYIPGKPSTQASVLFALSHIDWVDNNLNFRFRVWDENDEVLFDSGDQLTKISLISPRNSEWHFLDLYSMICHFSKK